MKVWQKIVIVVVVLITIGLVIYPNIVIDTGEKLIAFNYDGDFSEYDDNHSYNELYAYNEK